MKWEFAVLWIPFTTNPLANAIEFAMIGDKKSTVIGKQGDGAIDDYQRLAILAKLGKEGWEPWGIRPYPDTVGLHIYLKRPIK